MMRLAFLAGFTVVSLALAVWSVGAQTDRFNVFEHSILELQTATLAAERLQALAYPTIRRQAAPIGERQLGSNCQLSASTGLPALSVPAGFTADGMPVGLELLGPAFSERVLLQIAYAYEQVANYRRPPASTPALR